MADRIDILDDITWGKLVKTWATGKSYLSNNFLPPNLPRTVAELEQQCAAARGTATNVIIKIPAAVKGLVITQYSAEVLAHRLPPKSMVEAAEAELKAGGNYPIPKFYDTFYQTTLELADTAQKMDFHAARIGDYSIRNCG